jgi:hypothetical protein
MLNLHPLNREVIETAALLADTSATPSQHGCIDSHGKVLYMMYNLKCEYY